MSDRASRRVVVYRSSLLSLSETFVRDQVLALRRYDALLLGEQMVEPRPPLDGLHAATWRGAGAVGRVARGIDGIVERLSGHSPALARTVRAFDPSLIHVHFGTDAVRVWPTVSRMGLPMLVTLHGFDIHTHADWWRAGHGGDYLRTYPDRLLAMARDPRVRFVAVSKAVERSAIAYGLPADRVVVRHIGVDTANLLPGPLRVSERGRDVLFVGRLVEKKGAIYLIHAAARIKQDVPELRLVLVGDGPLRAALEAEAGNLGVDALFLGAQPHAAVLRQFKSARVFCLPSITADNGDAEGLPIVILEAQSFGVPVIASAAAAAEEGIEDGATGFAFAERDVDALAANLKAIVLDAARSDAMSTRAAAFARERFDIGTCTDRLEDLYDQVAGSRVR